MIDRGLHVALDVEVEHAIEESHPATELAVRNPGIGSGIIRLQMLNDRRCFDHRLTIVEEQRKLACGPDPLELGIVLLVLRNLAKFKLRPVSVERDQHLPGVGREGVTEEDDTHASSFVQFLRRSSSASLGSFDSKVPVCTSPSGSYVVKTTPRSVTKWSISFILLGLTGWSKIDFPWPSSTG